jgi:hypothetical protein
MAFASGDQPGSRVKCFLLIVLLRGTPNTIMGAFMNQLASGHLLQVTASARTSRTFTLDGAQPALDAFSRCIVALNAPAQPIPTPEVH